MAWTTQATVDCICCDVQATPKSCIQPESTISFIHPRFVAGRFLLRYNALGSVSVGRSSTRDCAQPFQWMESLAGAADKYLGGLVRHCGHWDSWLVAGPAQKCDTVEKNLACHGHLRRLGRPGGKRHPDTQRSRTPQRWGHCRMVRPNQRIKPDKKLARFSVVSLRAHRRCRGLLRPLGLDSTAKPLP